MSGSWTPLTNFAPSTIGTMMLLSDGTVMAQGGNVNNAWFKLTPDATGSYINGNWSVLAPMSTPRLYFGSNVLPSGKVLVVGGEYTNAGQVLTNTGEIYNPLTNTWTAMPNFPQSHFGDDPTVVLPGGKVLAGYFGGPQTYLYDPTNNSWAQTGTKLRNDQSDEETWVMLPDSSILSYDIFASEATGTSTAQRYMPATGTWVDAGTLPAPLSSGLVGSELGPGLLLPDGRVFQLGANGNTALYTPSTNTWAAGPTIPNNMGADDAPAAILPDGHVIFAADTPLFKGPTQLFDFDPNTNTITQLTTLPAQLTSLLVAPAFEDRMLVLPTGQLLFSQDSSAQLWVYTPDAGPSASWQPTISSITADGSGTYTLTGTQLNGISEGASYGDDAEMSSNYPIVQFTDATGHISYARTFNWTPGVATGTASVTTQFTLPTGFAPGAYSLRVIANGIASAPVSFIEPLAVAATTPAVGSLDNAPLTSFTVSFNEPIQPGTLQASAFTVNGISATGVVLDATDRTATFTFSSSPITTPGAQSMAIAANSIIGQDGTGIQGFNASFNYVPPDIVMVSAQSSGNTTLTLTYQVTGNTAPAFRFGLYSSADASFDSSDTLLGTVQVSDLSLLTVGTHTLNVAIGPGAGQIPLPGAGGALPASSFYVLAAANDNGAVAESSVANNTTALAGAYHTPGGDVIVQGSDGNDIIAVTSGASLTLIVNSLAPSYATSDVAAFDFYGHGGNDSINGAGVGKPMQFFAGPGSDLLAGGGVVNTLIGPDQANTWVLSGSNGGTLNSSSFTNFANLVGGALNDTFVIGAGASLSGTLDGRGGLNTLDYSTFGSPVAVNLATQTANALSRPWANIGAVTGSAAINTLTAADTANTWVINGANVGMVNRFAFTGFQNLNGGAGNDTFRFTGGGLVAGGIDGKGGANTLDYSARGSAATVNLQSRTATGITGTWANVQSATGTGTADTLIGANQTSTWTITAPNTGTINGAFTFSGFVNLTGGTAPDTFKFSDGAGVTGVIDGQGSTNALDYSAYTTGIYVNLLTASATGTGGAAKIANVTGGQGNDILVGDNNPNVFIETVGRNLIIGGGGKDTLTGGSGGDILIGGSTAYDTDIDVLDALLATWALTDLSYGARLAALQAGVTYTGNSGTHTAALNSSTVFDDGASDILNGGSGQDWFFAHSGSNSDTVNNLLTGEIVTAI